MDPFLKQMIILTVPKSIMSFNGNYGILRLASTSSTSVSCGCNFISESLL